MHPGLLRRLELRLRAGSLRSAGRHHPAVSLNPGDGTADDAPPHSGPGSVTPSGGQVDRLSFGVFGDVRPGSPNADEGYPTTTIGSIMAGIASHGAQFVVGTGDYMFSNTADSVKNQLDLLVQAETRFPGPVFHSLGNHECDGFTATNCISLTQTPNISAFMQRLVPFATQPYYSLTVSTSMGSAKLVFIAANFWNADQAAWLEGVLSVPTTYTFVVRHEPSDTPQTPGVVPSDAIMASHPVTLKLYGHAHEYRRVAINAVISGNGGAPMRTAGNFGYLIVRQLASGNIAVTEFAQGSDMPLDTWTLNPAGEAVTPTP